MIVYQTMTRAVEMPLEHFRFEPDPFGITGGPPTPPLPCDGACGCQRCRWNRGFKAIADMYLAEVTAAAESPSPQPPAPVFVSPAMLADQAAFAEEVIKFKQLRASLPRERAKLSELPVWFRLLFKATSLVLGVFMRLAIAWPRRGGMS